MTQNSNVRGAERVSIRKWVWIISSRGKHTFLSNAMFATSNFLEKVIWDIKHRSIRSSIDTFISSTFQRILTYKNTSRLMMERNLFNYVIFVIQDYLGINICCDMFQLFMLELTNIKVKSETQWQPYLDNKLISSSSNSI